MLWELRKTQSMILWWTILDLHYLKKFLPEIIWWFSMISTIFTFRNIHILLKNFVQNVYKVFYFSKLLYSNPLANVISYNVYSHNVMFHFDSKKFLQYDFSNNDKITIYVEVFLRQKIFHLLTSITWFSVNMIF